MASGRLRLFFALMPDARVLADLEAGIDSLAPHLHGRWVARNNLHLTLAFLGQVPVTTVPRLLEIGDLLARETPAFAMRMDRLGLWKRQEILWMGCRSTPSELQRFHQHLMQRLRAEVEHLPELDCWGGFIPHVTLARKVRGPLPEALPPWHLEWPCSSFSLVQSHLGSGGARYQALHSCPLQAP